MRFYAVNAVVTHLFLLFTSMLLHFDGTFYSDLFLEKIILKQSLVDPGGARLEHTTSFGGEILHFQENLATCTKCSGLRPLIWKILDPPLKISPERSLLPQTLPRQRPHQMRFWKLFLIGIKKFVSDLTHFVIYNKHIASYGNWTWSADLWERVMFLSSFLS